MTHHGTGIQPGRFLSQLFHDAGPVRPQWAEVFFDSGIASLRGAGSLRFEGRAWMATGAFTRGNEIPGLVATPILLPDALGLLLAPLLLLTSCRRGPSRAG